MSKTYRVYAVAAAQGLIESDRDDYPGYVSENFTTGREYYQDTDKYPVSFQFEQIPETLKPFEPLKVRLSFYAGTTEAVTVSREYSLSWPSYGDEPSDAAIIENAKNTARSEVAGIEYRTLSTPIDIQNGVFSCEARNDRYKNEFYIRNTTSTGTVRTRQGEGEWVGSQWYGKYEKYTTWTITVNGVGALEKDKAGYYDLYIPEKGIRLNAAIKETKIFAPSAQYPAYIEFEYYEGGLVTYTNSPAGYEDETRPITFSWHTTYTGFPVEDAQQTSARIEWKNGESGTVHSISISGGTKTYTMPANTLPESTNILWRVVAQTTEGSSTSAWATIQTVDSQATALALSPSAIYVDGMKEMRFEWNHSTDTGTAQRAYDLQYKTAAADWTTVKHEETENEYSVLNAGVLPSGSISWRVRTYNAENEPGAWSNELTIVVIAAPAAPSVSVSVSAPRPVISWQSREQQAFEVEIGTNKSGTVFGTAKTYQSPVYLSDGLHIVRVRVLNEFNIWSPWGETTLNVLNVPGETAVTLNVSAGIDAKLAWSEVPGVSEYLIFRNGERIGRTSGTNYTDRTYLGLATYFVRAAHTDGYNYTDSNRVTVTLAASHVMIAALDGDWLDIGLSLTSLPAVQVNRSRDVAMMQYNGTVLPVPEISPFEHRIYSINCAFADRQEAARFDDLMAQLCIVKDQYGNCMVGMLQSYSRTQNTFTTAYTAALYEVDRSVYEES